MKRNQQQTDLPTGNAIRGLIEDKPLTPYQIIVVIMCFVLNMNDGIDVLVVSYTGSEILAEWGLTKAQQGYIFSAGLLGMTLGCLLIAPLADRFGRRRLFIFTVVLDTVGMLLASVVTAYWQLLGLRFVAGLGIGGLLPTMATMASEFTNNRRKDLAVGFVQAGWPIGAILMGFYTARTVPEMGWRFGFFSGAMVSVAMLVMVIAFMPESIEYLIKSQPRNALQKINKILSRMGHEPVDKLPDQKSMQKPSVTALYTKEYKVSTMLLWTGTFFGFMTLFTLISWVPSIARDSGMPFRLATYVGTVLNIGAFMGSTGIGWLAARFKLRKLIFIFFVVAFGIMVTYGNITLGNALVFVLTFLIGVFVQGGFNGYWPAAARIYQTEIRATGIGWATGAGRLGAIIGPAIFGVLSDLKLPIATLFIIFSIPLIISGTAAFLIPSKNLK